MEGISSRGFLRKTIKGSYYTYPGLTLKDAAQVGRPHGARP